jgi:hypothetical protein
MSTPHPAPPLPPDLTPAPAVLQALAHVAEVDLAKGLGRQRLAQVIHADESGARSLGRWLLAAAALLLVAAAALALLLR